MPGYVLYKVFSTSGAGCGVANTALEHIIDRRFGHRQPFPTRYKDLNSVLDITRSLGVPLRTASTTKQLFQAEKTSYPDGDNLVCTLVIEEIGGAEHHRNGSVP